LLILGRRVCSRCFSITGSVNDGMYGSKDGADWVCSRGCFATAVDSAALRSLLVWKVGLSLMRVPCISHAYQCTEPHHQELGTK
jgi:hypothetical protein